MFKRNHSSDSKESFFQNGMTLRSFIITIFAMLLLGYTVNFTSVYSLTRGQFAENSPPNGGVVVILVLMAIGSLLFLIHRTLKLKPQELVIIYSALLISAPLMTESMWHRIFGLFVSIPHNSDFKSYESLPSSLWPHGTNLVKNGRFQNGFEGYSLDGPGRLEWEKMNWRKKDWKCPVIVGTENISKRTSIALTLKRKNDAGKDILVPGESFLFSALVKAKNLAPESSYFVRMKADNGPFKTLVTNTGDTQPTFALPNAFSRIGINDLRIPTNLKDKLTIYIGIIGPGKLTVNDLEFFNVEVVESCFAGRRVISEKNLPSLKDNERNFILVKPNNMFSWAGVKYILTGFIPLKEWFYPALTWSSIIALLFAGYFGFNVIMRKQWVDNERYFFPLNIIPRHLFQEEDEDDIATGSGNRSIGKLLRPIFRSKAMWIGFAVTFPIVMLKGIAFYFPKLPDPNTWSDVWQGVELSDYFTNPLLRTYFSAASVRVAFSILAITLLMETDILFSIWVGFFLFQFLPLMGQIFNFNRFVGYPWQEPQGVGAFTAMAFMAIVIGRNHLWRVLKHIVGRDKLDDSDEVISYRAALALIIISLAGIYIWGYLVNGEPLGSMMFFGFVLVCGFAASKIRAEAGPAFNRWTPYHAMILVATVGGIATFGPSSVLVAAMASGFMGPSGFILMAPIQVEMLELGKRFQVKPKHVAFGLTLGLVGALFIGGYTFLSTSYGVGGDNQPFYWYYAQNWYYDSYREESAMLDRAVAAKDINIPEKAPLNFFNNVDAKGMGIGFVVTGGLYLLRSAFAWFPFHPLGYVFACSWFGGMFWFSALLAWIARITVLKFAGAHGVRKGLVPFSIGMFFACMISIIIFTSIGVYLRTHGITRIYGGIP